MVHRQQIEDGTEASPKQTVKELLKSVGLAVMVLAVFGLGIGVGSGRVSFDAAPASKTNAQLPDDLNYTSVEQVYDTIKRNYDGKLTEDQLLDGLKAGLAQATGDPYTEYFNTEEAKEFQEQLSGSFTGIGAELGLNANNILIVVTPIRGFPAEKAGLRAQDLITSIDGKPTTGMSISDAVKLIRGEKGTDVTLQVIRGDEDLKLTITRDEIKIPSVKWEVRDDGIGVMTLNQFNEDTSSLAERAAREFKDQDVKGVVLDLRGNPGGLLNSAVDVSSLWLPKGRTVLQEKQGGVVTKTYKSDGGDILRGVPTVVLINAGSASASEIVAGALRDNKAATLVGEKSYGKGSVQQVQELTGGAEIKVTIARWFRPNGQNIDKKGITPDTKVELTEDDFKNQRDPQLDKAIELVSEQ